MEKGLEGCKRCGKGWKRVVWGEEGRMGRKRVGRGEQEGWKRAKIGGRGLKEE